MALGFPDRPRAGAAALGQAVPDDPAAHGHLPRRQVRRLDVGGRGSGDRLLPSLHRVHRRVRRGDHRRSHRLRAEVLMAMVAAPPFVSYSSLTEALIPADRWGLVYSSLQALKGHVQEYPGCQGFDVFIRAEADGEVLVHCYTTWDTPAQLEVFLERG